MLSCAIESRKLKTASQTPLELRFQTKPDFLWSDALVWNFGLELRYVRGEAGPEVSVMQVDLTKGDVVLELVAGWRLSDVSGSFLIVEVAAIPCKLTSAVWDWGSFLEFNLDSI